VHVRVVQPVQIVCIGEGPVVHITPDTIDWQHIPVLTDTPKTLKLSNESLIPAHFTANLVLLAVFDCHSSYRYRQVFGLVVWLNNGIGRINKVAIRWSRFD